MKQHLNIKVFGLVQGVFFRATAKKQADKLKISGFTKNMPDGSVYIEAEGEKGKLNEFLKWCNSGPQMARITKVIISESNVKNYSEFKIY